MDIGPSTVEITAISSGQKETAQIESASEADMPTDWDFAWPEFWQKTDFSDHEAIIKLVYREKIWGLMRYSLYSTRIDGPVNQMVISHLETHPDCRGDNPHRLIRTVGLWLVWYAVNVALQCCFLESDEHNLIVLSSLNEAVPYYRDVVKMRFLGHDRGAPGEDMYGFAFSKSEAISYCERYKLCGMSGWAAD
ncbi:MAG: hypothetical protein WCA07_16935 [Gloeobacterales cyanobacterium]